MSKERYDRQIRLNGFGEKAQERLNQASVLIVGAGGLGVPSALYLNAMGVGRLTIIDGDQIELSNLHRQPIYLHEDIGKPKVTVLGNFLKRQNPETQLTLFDTFLNATNALEIMRGHDIVIDATDNLPTRYLIDDASLILETPWIYGALHGFEGQISVFNLYKGPTYRCLFPTMPDMDEIPDCNQMGTLGILPGIVGSMQALEAVKVLCDLDGALSGRLWLYNSLDQQSQLIAFSRNDKRTTPGELDPSTYQYASCQEEGSIGPEAFSKLLQTPGSIHLVDVREPSEFLQSSIPGSMNIPLLNLKAGMPELSAKKTLILICKSGPRSRQAYQFLTQHNPDLETFWVQGGMRQYNLMYS